MHCSPRGRYDSFMTDMARLLYEHTIIFTGKGLWLPLVEMSRGTQAG
jgi:hypothetical protein